METTQAIPTDLNMTPPESGLVTEFIFHATGTDSDRSGNIQSLLKSPYLDWERFDRLINYHELRPLAYVVLKSFQQEVPARFWHLIQNAYFCTLSNNTLFEQAFREITSLFRVRHISFVPIKGLSFLAGVYAEHPYRPMVDMDILIRKEDLRAAGEVLTQAGYKRPLDSGGEIYHLEKQMHLAYAKTSEIGSSFLVEVHWALDYPRKIPMLSGLWKRTRQISYGPEDSGHLEVLSPEDQLFTLALHQRRFSKVFVLKYTIDVILLFRQHDMDVHYILAESGKSRLHSALYALLVQVPESARHARCRELVAALKVPGFKRRLIRYLVKKYRYDPPRDVRSLFMKFHFLLFDSFREPFLYILFIPYEQFCKYYGLNADSQSARLLYEIRHFYGFFRMLWQGLCTVFQRSAR